MSDQGLLPCPFCGGRAKFTSGFTDHRDVGKVYCIDCQATVGKYIEPKAEAITAWNTRTPPTTGDNPHV